MDGSDLGEGYDKTASPQEKKVRAHVSRNEPLPIQGQQAA